MLRGFLGVSQLDITRDPNAEDDKLMEQTKIYQTEQVYAISKEGFMADASSSLINFKKVEK